jgi:hypothetical protein
MTAGETSFGYLIMSARRPLQMFWNLLKKCQCDEVDRAVAQEVGKTSGE